MFRPSKNPTEVNSDARKFYYKHSLQYCKARPWQDPGFFLSPDFNALPVVGVTERMMLASLTDTMTSIKRWLAPNQSRTRRDVLLLPLRPGNSSKSDLIIVGTTRDSSPVLPLLMTLPSYCLEIFPSTRAFLSSISSFK